MSEVASSNQAQPLSQSGAFNKKSDQSFSRWVGVAMICSFCNTGTVGHLKEVL